jgi:basic membrane protein A and related proteins
VRRKSAVAAFVLAVASLSACGSDAKSDTTVATTDVSPAETSAATVDTTVAASAADTTGAMAADTTAAMAADTTAAMAADTAAAMAAAESTATGVAMDQTCTGKKVTFVSTQKAGDQSVVDDMVNNGLDASKDKLGADTKYVEALDPATFESTLRNVAQSGANVVATTFLEMGEPLQTVAKEFPKVRFIQIYAIPVTPALPNLRTVSYRYDEATYLSGLVAGTATKSKTLGYEGGLFVPGINTDFNAFKKAAQSIDPSIKVIPGEVGSFADDAKAKEVVSALYTQGADIVQGDGPVIGHIEAAKDKKGYVIMGAPGLVDKAPELIMGVTFIKFGDSLFNQIKDACGDSFKGDHQASGIKDDITGFYIPEQFIAKGDPAIVAKAQSAMPLVEKAIADIKSGALEVPVDNAKP